MMKERECSIFNAQCSILIRGKGKCKKEEANIIDNEQSLRLEALFVNIRMLLR